MNSVNGIQQAKSRESNCALASASIKNPKGTPNARIANYSIRHEYNTLSIELIRCVGSLYFEHQMDIKPIFARYSMGLSMPVRPLYVHIPFGLDNSAFIFH